MKKALLLVLVLAFALVPVFSSVASAEAVKAADFTIGAGYNVDGTLVPATLTDTADGVVFEQSKGYFGPDFDAMGEGTNFGDGMNGKFGAYLTEGFDPMDADEISATFSLDEYASLYTDSTGATQEADGWLKFTVTGTPGTIDFTDADADGAPDMRGITISVQQAYYFWGTEYKRFRVWISGINLTESWGVISAAWVDSMAGQVDAVFEGDRLGEDLTITLQYRPVQAKYLVKAKMGDDEQILHAGLNLTDGSTALLGAGAEKFYLGFASAMQTDRKALQPAPETWDEDGTHMLMTGGDLPAEVKNPDGTVNVDAIKAIENWETIYGSENGEPILNEDHTGAMVIHEHKVGDQKLDPYTWQKQWSNSGKANVVEATNVKATIKDIYVGEARQQDTPVIIVTADPTETPVVPQAGQDFSLAIILGSMAGMLALAGAAVLVNKSRKNA